MGFVHNFGDTAVELILGGRQHIYLRNFEEFLLELRKCDVKLAFFCDGQLQAEKNDVWCQRRDADFQAALRVIDEHSHPDAPRKRFGCKTIAKSLLKLVEDKSYGKVVISTEVDCDKAIAKYAMEKVNDPNTTSPSFEDECFFYHLSSIFQMTGRTGRCSK